MRRLAAERIDGRPIPGKPGIGLGWGRRCGLVRASNSARQPPSMACGASRKSGAAPRAVPRTHGTRAASGHRPAGHYEPPARSSLTTGHFRRKRGPELKTRRRPRPRAAVERREARRSASWAGDLGRSRDRPVARCARVRRSAPAPVGALPPSGGATKGDARRFKKCKPRAAQRWLWVEQRKSLSALTLRRARSARLEGRAARASRRIAFAMLLSMRAGR